MTMSDIVSVLLVAVVAVVCGLVARHVMARRSIESSEPQLVLEPSQDVFHFVDEEGYHWLWPPINLPNDHRLVRILVVCPADGDKKLVTFAALRSITQGRGKVEIGAVIQCARVDPKTGRVHELHWWRHNPSEERPLLPVPLVVPAPAFNSGALPPQDFTITL